MDSRSASGCGVLGSRLCASALNQFSRGQPNSFVDLTRHKLEQAHSRMLIDELDHHVKNTLSTVQSIVTEALRRQVSFDAIKESISSRIFALSRSHHLLSDMNWVGTGLHDLLDAHRDIPFCPQGMQKGCLASPYIPTRAYADAHLPPRHRDNCAGCCPTAALASAVRLQSPAARSAMTEGLRSQFDRVGKALPELDAADRCGAAMVGAVILARAIDDPALSDEILKQTREWVDAGIDPQSELSFAKDAMK